MYDKYRHCGLDFSCSFCSEVQVRRNLVQILAMFQLQRVERADLFPRTATVRQIDPLLIADSYHVWFNEQLDRLIDLTPDPTGAGIVNAQQQVIRSAVIGATLITCTAIIGQRQATTGAYILPASTALIEAWFRANAPKATINLSEVEATVAFFTAATRPFLYEAPWKAEVVSVLAEPTVVDQATCGALMQQLLTHAGPPPGPAVARPVGAAIGVQAALAAYYRFVHFKAASLGLMPLAASTSGRSAGELLTRVVVQGTTVTVLTNVRTHSWTDVEFLVAIMFRYFTAQNAFNGIDATWNQAPSTDYGVAKDLQDCFTIVARGSMPTWEVSLLKAIAGPRLTFWPPPFNAPPIQQLLAGPPGPAPGAPPAPGAVPGGPALGPPLPGGAPNPVPLVIDPNAAAGLIHALQAAVLPNPGANPAPPPADGGPRGAVPHPGVAPKAPAVPPPT